MMTNRRQECCNTVRPHVSLGYLPPLNLVNEQRIADGLIEAMVLIEGKGQ